MGLYTSWIFSPYSTIVIESCNRGIKLTRKAIGRELSAKARIDQGVILFEGKEFSIRFDPGKPCSLKMDGECRLLEIGGGAGPLWLAFTGGSFEIVETLLSEGDMVSFGFRDESGSYRVYLNHSDNVKKISASEASDDRYLRFSPKGACFPE